MALGSPVCLQEIGRRNLVEGLGMLVEGALIIRIVLGGGGGL